MALYKFTYLLIYAHGGTARASPTSIIELAAVIEVNKQWAARPWRHSQQVMTSLIQEHNNSETRCAAVAVGHHSKTDYIRSTAGLGLRSALTSTSLRCPTSKLHHHRHLCQRHQSVTSATASPWQPFHQSVNAYFRSTATAHGTVRPECSIRYRCSMYYYWRRLDFTGHYLRWRMPPFMRQCWGLLHKLAQCTRPQGWGS